MSPGPPAPSDLVAAWRTSNEANLFLLERIPAARMRDAYASRTRDVAAQFAHMHSARLRWLLHAAPELAQGLKRIPRDSPTRAELRSALKESARAIAAFLERCESSGKVKGWNGPPATFLSYLVAHEAHHRALAMVALRLSGHPADQKVVYGLWDWGKKLSRR